jgi:hypothetical protein
MPIRELPLIFRVRARAGGVTPSVGGLAVDVPLLQLDAHHRHVNTAGTRWRGARRVDPADSMCASGRARVLSSRNGSTLDRAGDR